MLNRDTEVNISVESAAELIDESEPESLNDGSEPEEEIFGNDYSADGLFKNALEGFKAEASSEKAFDNVLASVGKMKDRARSSSVRVVSQKKYVAEKVDELFEGLKREPTHIDTKGNPFLYYGIGVHNFIRMNSRFTQLFLILMILSFLQMLIFRAFSGLENFSNITSTVKWTLGSIGQPKSLCAKNFVDWNKDTIDLHFKCEG